ncbi:NADH-quinone oxidoreductase subunit N [Armatimonas rosea]|uniref:NADH-quinone oxidoreductase subunit N n=1 Tax=Armatimonas rosea TaxID=685828 RepID=A0A7W9SVP3_ARMRO|nr:NADH-quinone oxidoreductase subunit N [Armatimonas rosea]MBB6053720.1 NADH-quinone oxidoreductase subunit N [Armatimonas rosea]
MTETLENLQALLAPLVVLICGMLVLLLDLRRKAFAERKSLALTCFVGLALGAFATLPGLGAAALSGIKLQAADQSLTRLFGGGMTVDGFSSLLSLTLCLVAALTIGMSGRYLEDKKLPFGEFYALVLFATAGAMVMVSALDLVNVFVGLEVLSVALYILAGYARRELRSEESAVKYFLLGAFASGFLLYGIALVYGAVGIAVRSGALGSIPGSFTSLITLTEALHGTAGTEAALGHSPLFLAGIALILVGLGFKASLVPFHSYAPDVYQGAPAPIAAFMSAAAKIGAFVVLVRLLMPFAEPGVGGEVVRNALVGIAVATMLVGNILAIRQTNLKRMLAYSSVAHAGYLLVGVIAASTPSASGRISALAADSVGFYLLAYSLMNLGIFAVTVWLGRSGEEEFCEIGRFAGLARRNPAAAAVVTILMLSLAGIPLTAGFLGKFYLFYAAMQAGLVWLAAVGLVISVIGLVYYLNLVVQMYFREPADDTNPELRAGAAKNVAVVCAVLLLVLGILPSGILGPTRITDNLQLMGATITDPGMAAGRPRPGGGGPAAPRPGNAPNAAPAPGGAPQ